MFLGPGDLDAQQAAEGAEVFAARCASRHGIYSDAPAAEKTECPEVAADDGTEESPPKKVKTTDEKIAEAPGADEAAETAKST